MDFDFWCDDFLLCYGKCLMIGRVDSNGMLEKSYVYEPLEWFETNQTVV